MADNELDRLIKLNDVLQSRADSAFAKAEQSVLQGGRALESTNDSTAIDEIESFTGASNLAAAARNPPQRSSSKQSNQTTMKTEAADNLELLPSSTLGKDAAILFFKDKLEAVTEQLKQVLLRSKEMERALEASKTDKKQLDESNSRLAKQNALLTSEVEKQKKELAAVKTRYTTTESSFIALRKEIDTLRKSNKQLEVDNQTREMRLNRMSEELQRSRSSLSQDTSKKDEALQAAHQEISRQLSDIKRLERQKQELLQGFRKQMQLIEVLRRKMLHVESAKLLAITEDEFMRFLE